MLSARRHDATRRAFVSALLIGSFALSGAAEAGDPIRLLICQPGGTTLGDEQQGVIEKMYRYIERKTGLEKGRIQGVYTNEREKCLTEMEKGPTIVIPSLPIYLEYKDKYGLTPVAQVRLNGKVEDQYYLMVNAKGPATVEALTAGPKPAVITGTHVASPSFLLDIVLEGKVAAKNVKVQPERFALRALRDVGNNKADAVLLDGTQYRAIPGSRFEQQLRLLHTSRPLPTPPITVVDKRAPPGFGAKLGQALATMTSDPEGMEVVRIFQIEGFELAAPKTFGSLEKQIKSAP